MVAGRRPASGKRPAADRLLPRRGARGPAALPARDPPARSEGDWEAAVWVGDSTEVRIAQAAARARRASFGPRDGSAGGADRGGRRARRRLRRSAAGARGRARGARLGTVPVCSQIPLYNELTRDGEIGLLFQPGDAITLAGQLERLLGSASLRRELSRKARGAVRDWAAVADQVEAIYARICARRHDPRGNPELRRKIARRREIHVDLHMHTDHSSDCATPVETLLATAREAGLGAIAITDHNEVSGAFAAAEIADEFGVKVIVAEEVKTAEQGEVIGLFLNEKIERGMTMAETIAEIRRQGGLVYVPHPFDRLHSVPDYEHLLDIVEEIDILEVFNPRVALTAFNEEAERFAAKYRIVPGAGSDSHVAQGLGSVMIRVHDFDGPRGVPRGDARRRHRPQAQEPGLRADAEVAADRRRARRQAGQRAAAARAAGTRESGPAGEAGPLAVRLIGRVSRR